MTVDHGTHRTAPPYVVAHPGPPLPASDAWTGTDPTGQGHDDDPRWRTDAACRGTDPGLFFPRRGDNARSRAAKAICAGCPVQADCLTYALDHGEKFGIWGGTTDQERANTRTRGAA